MSMWGVAAVVPTAFRVGNRCCVYTLWLGLAPPCDPQQVGSTDRGGGAALANGLAGFRGLRGRRAGGLLPCRGGQAGWPEERREQIWS